VSNSGSSHAHSQTSIIPLFIAIFTGISHGNRVVNEYAPLIEDAKLRELVLKCRFEPETELRRSVIHGDANDYNVLVQGEDVVGLIDFGDMVPSYRAGELAIALAYVVVDDADPLLSAKNLVAGYLSVLQLTEHEINSLWSLMLLRLAMSICIAAHQRQQKPDNDYLDVSQRAIRASLPRLLAIDPGLAAKSFLSADYADYTARLSRNQTLE